MSGALFAGGRVAVVTGAASGIGRSVAERFAEEGVAVALFDRDAAQGQAVRDEIQARGGTAHFCRVDVGSEQDVIAALKEVSTRFGAIHHLVNCAGMVLVKGIEECSAQDWDRVFDVNVKSIFLMVKHALPLLRTSPGATVVNIASVSAIVAQKGTPAYVASKGAVMMLSKALALDLADYGIRVNSVCPGITDTPMFHLHVDSTHDPAATLEKRLKRVPLARMLSPREIADAVLYLSSDRASGITGTELVVDAGYTAAAEMPDE